MIKQQKKGMKIQKNYNLKKHNTKSKLNQISIQ